LGDHKVKTAYDDLEWIVTWLVNHPESRAETRRFIEGLRPPDPAAVEPERTHAYRSSIEVGHRVVDMGSCWPFIYDPGALAFIGESPAPAPELIEPVADEKTDMEKFFFGQ
jgi:hypothetical protein